MKRSVLFLVLTLVVACSTPPPPATVPEPAATAPAAPLGTGRVSATALNVRAGASTDAEILTTLRRGASLTLLEEANGWYRVQLASGGSGWVSAQFVSRGGAAASSTSRRRSGCPPDSDFAFEKSPLPSFTEDGAHGLVVVEANVTAGGNVTSTRVISNATGDPALGAMAEREIRSAKFIAPVRNCVRRSFIFTYKRAF